MDINPKVQNWFTARGINPETVARMGICSGRHHQTGGEDFEVIPEPQGNVIVFPYVRKGSILNEKYRAAGKKFYQKKLGQKLFWNADILDDPALHDGRNQLVITEGELDALSVIEAGNPFVVSVPDGAPPPREDGEQPTHDIEYEHDDKYRYILNDWTSLKKIKRIIIATDNDAPGKQLSEELVRRLGRARCSFVNYPDGCKDFNDVLLKYGPSSVIEVITRARPYPVGGVYSYDELPPEPNLTPVSTGWSRLDQYLKLFYPALLVVTGYAGTGKSTWVNQLIAQLNIHHGWKAGIASFEMRIKPFVTEVLMQTYVDNNNQPHHAEKWLNDNFVFIAPEPSDEDDSFDIDWLIDKAIVAVIRYGIRVLVIDPWNEIEHATGKRESTTEYTGRAIRKLKRFGREFEVLVIIVAHPTKEASRKSPEDISLYDVDGSANFANKADFGVVIARHGIAANDYVSSIFVKKIRYQPVSGRPGSIELVYDPAVRTFSP